MSDTTHRIPTPAVCTAFKNGLRKKHNLEVQDIADALYVGSLYETDGPVSTKHVGVSFADYQKCFPALLDVPEYTNQSSLYPGERLCPVFYCQPR